MQHNRCTAHLVIILLLHFAGQQAHGNDEISGHIRKCCVSGIQYAGKHNSCEKYDYEVATIPPLWRGLCHSTYGLCCSRKLEEQYCVAGRLAALRGSRCNELHNTTAYADCCHACQVGLAVKASNNYCNDALFSYFGHIESYRVCCGDGGGGNARDSSQGHDSLGETDDIANESDEHTLVANSDRKLKPMLSHQGDRYGNEDEASVGVNDGTIVLQADDDDICGKVPNLCAQICENTNEAYRCKCRPGYKLDDNNVTCSLLTGGITDSVDDDADVEDEIANGETDAEGETGNNNVAASPEEDDDGTLRCTGGYEYDYLQHKCIDVNECTAKLDDCKNNQYCHNTIGSYRCLNVKLKNCESGWVYNTQLQKCEDVDECAEKLDDCTGTQQCVNTRGSFKCQPLKENAAAPDKTADKKNCKSGYVYSAETEMCEDYDECSGLPCEDAYTCINYPGRYECKKNPLLQNYDSNSVGSKVAGEEGKCGAGFQYKHGRCMDIDECAVDENACDSSQVCTNDIGGYHCDCKVGFNLDTITNACVDINECSINNHNCLPTQRCDNTVGSYICTRLQSCGTGYTLNAETANCDDDDECALGTHNCPVDYECYNTKGSFRCYRRLSSATSSTTSTTTTTTPPPTLSPSQLPFGRNQTTYRLPGEFSSRQTNSRTDFREYLPHYISSGAGAADNALLPPCDLGFQRNHLRACVDVNECLLANSCGSHQRCINTNGSYRCQNLLQCPAGYKSTPDGTKCIDIDECETGEHNCAENQICRNRNGGYICSCPPGHQLTRLGNGISRCVDIDECAQEHPLVCPSNAQCLNTVGSFYCECKSGFQKSKDNDRICLDVDECQEIAGLCQQKCVNFWGGYRCTCNQGFELSPDNRTCNDVDECEVHKSYKLCMGYCNNVPGSYECSCPRGYTLAMDKNTCRDVDECATGEFCTGRNDICTNIRGGYKCTAIHCQYGYVNDPDQKNRCRLTSNLCEGDECYNKPSAYTYNFITLVSKLMIPPEGRTIFSLRGPLWYDDIDFDLKIIKIQAAANIEKASDNHFDTIKGKHEVHLLLKRSLHGPQDIELELSMTVFTNGMPRGKSIAKIFILVSQYTF